jgi:hypothetical protein
MPGVWDCAQAIRAARQTEPYFTMKFLTARMMRLFQKSVFHTGTASGVIGKVVERHLERCNARVLTADGGNGAR